MRPVHPVAPSVAPKCKPVREWLSISGELPSFEVIVVGTGAGGAVAGTELALKGKRVLFLEMGGAYDTKDFKKKSLIWSTTKLFQNQGMQIAGGDLQLLLISGRGVGGSTLINSGICFRPPEARLEEWSAAVGSTLSSDHLKPFIDEIWLRAGVMPTHEGIGRRHNRVFQDGATRMGFEHAFIDRNAPGCVGCGICHLGCPSGGKASVDKAFLPSALNAGAEVRTGARVDRVLIEGGRATGVVLSALGEDGEPQGELTLRADRVLIAGSALRTPVLLENSGVTNAHLGKHLAIHPAGGVVGDFEEPVVMWNGVPQGYWARMEGEPDITLETSTIGPGELFGVLGRAGDTAILQRFKHLALSGGMIRDTGLGEVRADGESPKIDVRFSETDIERLKKGLKGCIQVYFAAGAKSVQPFVHPARFFDNEKDAMDAVDRVKVMSDFGHVHASHPHGTARMGKSAATGVVDEHGKVFGTDELFVVDGSIFPSTLGVNPQITIMSLALSLARRMT